MKTNMKLGGLNYALALNHQDIVAKWFVEERAMMLGCDVNHPPPQPPHERGKPPREPSVVGFVGNMPHKPMLFTGEIAMQNPREETVQSVDRLTTEFAARWMNHSAKKTLPPTIFYFRDGVSEGQYQTIIEREVGKLRATLKKIGGSGYNPKITAIVVVKRHHTRLYNQKLNPSDSATRQDIPVGTVVDRGIVNPSFWEFYLKNHQALQGTAKPTRYVMIVEENGLTQDEVDALCYALSHGHQIVTKSVSLPAPVYGAHEMAERGKRLWRAYSELESSSSGISSESGTASDYAEERDWEAITDTLKVGNKFADRKHWA